MKWLSFVQIGTNIMPLDDSPPMHLCTS